VSTYDMKERINKEEERQLSPTSQLILWIMLATAIWKVIDMKTARKLDSIFHTYILKASRTSLTLNNKWRRLL
jgi:hypothetical protein